MRYSDIPAEQINMVLTDFAGCALNDIIYLPISPIKLEFMAAHFKLRALAEHESYRMQGWYRELSDHFERIYDEWKKRTDQRSIR